MILLLGVYPIVFHNYYFDITFTKFIFFVSSVLIGFVLYIIWELCREPDENKQTIPLTRTDWVMLLFAVSQMAAWLLADNRTEAFWGADSRYQGFFLIIVYLILYFTLSRGYQRAGWYLGLWFGVSTLMFLLAIFQQFGLDMIGFYNRLSPGASSSFISTIGNINVFSEYCCIVLGVSVVYFCEAALKWPARLGMVFELFFGAMALVCGRSDSGAIGLAIFACFLLCYYLLRGKRGGWLFTALAILCAGIGTIGVLQARFSERAFALQGVTVYATKEWWWILSAVCVLLAVFLFCVSHWAEAPFAALVSRIVWISIVIIGFAAAVRTVLLFTGTIAFTDSWGSGRGYIWKRLWRMFVDFPLWRKFIGAGQGSVILYMKAFFAEEMKQAGYVFDNAHNVYLQYLFTSGVLGLVGYLSLLASSIGLNESERNRPILCALAGGIIFYSIQAFVNIGQPITTPFLFVLIGWIEGERQWEMRMSEKQQPLRTIYKSERRKK